MLENVASILGDSCTLFQVGDPPDFAPGEWAISFNELDTGNVDFGNLENNNNIRFTPYEGTATTWKPTTDVTWWDNYETQERIIRIPSESPFVAPIAQPVEKVVKCLYCRCKNPIVEAHCIGCGAVLP